MAGNVKDKNRLLNNYILPTQEEVDNLNKDMRDAAPVVQPEEAMNPSFVQQIDQNNERERFLKAMAQLESGGGKYLDHKPAKVGVNKGEVAYGQYGFMPNTVRDLANKAGYPELKSAENEAIYRALSNPDIERKYAEALYDHLKDRTNDDEIRAYMWQMGHNIAPKNVEKAKQHQRVKKFRALTKKN